MNASVGNTPLPRLDRMGSVSQKSKRLDHLGLGVLAGMLLFGQAMATNPMAEAQAPELATVNSAELGVYAETDTTSTVVGSLMRGDLVEIDRVIPTAGGVWCSITQIGGGAATGYVQCDALRRRPATPSKPLRFIEEPIPKPQSGVSAPQAKPGRGYSIQVASLVREDNTRALKARLEKLGFQPMIHLTMAPITRHRVYAGQFSSRAEAELTANRLQGDGYRASLVELEDRTFSLEVESTFRRDEAVKVARTLQQKGYSPKIVSKTVPTQVHQVRVGDYQNRAEAAKALEVLQQQGFTPLLVRQ